MRDLAFWLAVAFVAIAAVVLFKIVGVKVPWHPVNVLAAAA